MTADSVSAQVGADPHQQVAPVRQAVIRGELLEGPIAAQMLGLAWPVLVVLALQTSVGVAETYFVSSPGSDAVAGVALVFPIFMLMTMMSNGGIGGGVSSAVARAIGAGRKRDAEARCGSAGHAFSDVGHPVRRNFHGLDLVVRAIALPVDGGAGRSPCQCRPVRVVFLFAVPGWIANLLAAALRGAGNVRVPAFVTAIGSVMTLALSPLFIFGWGVVPRMGVAGAAVALGLFNVGCALALALYVRSSRSPIRLAAALRLPRRCLF